jgi:hypothetical protein
MFPFVRTDRKVPHWFASTFKAQRSPANLDWMRRHQVSEEALRSKAYSTFLLLSL